MKTICSLVLLTALTPLVSAKPLVIPNDAWRASALSDVAPLLRACLPKNEPNTLPRLPVFKGPAAGIDTPVGLQEPAQANQGYSYRLGYRARDGQVFVVARRGSEGAPTVFGPVGADWTCLPAEVRKELADK